MLAGLACARADVAFSGLDDRLETNVRALVPLATADCDSARWRIDRLYRDADKSIRKALEPLGYYAPIISKSLEWGDSCWHANFDIETGAPVKLRLVNIEIGGGAESDRDFQSRITAERPVPGDILDHGIYTKFKASLIRAADHTGYFDADFGRSVVTVDRDALSADIDIHFDSGQKYQFGNVDFTAGILRQRLLQGYTDIRPGEPYSARAINELYEALSGSSYFNSVSIRTEPLDTMAKIVPVNVSLTPSKRRVYSFGGGYTTDTGPHGKLGFADRRINDRGHQFDSRLFLSPVRSELNGSYRWPRRDPRKEWFSIVAGMQTEDTETSEHDTYKLGISRTRNIGTKWLETRYADIMYEDYVIADQRSTSQLVIIGASIERAKGRALSRVSNGYRFSIDLRGASDSLGSDTSFLQLRSRMKWIRSIGDKTRVLLRADLGSTAKDELSELPASVRFFTGGDRSVRGYEFETLGPLDANGEVIGGSHLLTGSIEIDRTFRDTWAVAAFADAGSAFNDADMDFSTGVGLGIRWYSPVGPIRLDLAHPLDNPDENVRIHISLGPDL